MRRAEKGVKCAQNVEGEPVGFEMRRAKQNQNRRPFERMARPAKRPARRVCIAAVEIGALGFGFVVNFSQNKARGRDFPDAPQTHAREKALRQPKREFFPALEAINRPVGGAKKSARAKRQTSRRIAP